MTLGTCSIYQPIIFLMHVRQAIIDPVCPTMVCLAASATVGSLPSRQHLAYLSYSFSNTVCSCTCVVLAPILCCNSRRVIKRLCVRARARRLVQEVPHEVRS